MAAEMDSEQPLSARGPLIPYPVRMAQADIDRISKLAQADGVSASEWVRQAIGTRMFGSQPTAQVKTSSIIDDLLAVTETLGGVATVFEAALERLGGPR